MIQRAWLEISKSPWRIVVITLLVANLVFLCLLSLQRTTIWRAEQETLQAIHDDILDSGRASASALPSCPSGVSTNLPRPFTKPTPDGAAYSSKASSFEGLADTNKDPTRSTIVLCENGRLLGPPHSPHAEIIASGKGRYSHWNGIGFVFSTSDNTDPNVNGRRYKAVVPD
jgi:hypothetical protein